MNTSRQLPQTKTRQGLLPNPEYTIIMGYGVEYSEGFCLSSVGQLALDSIHIKNKKKCSNHFQIS